MLMSDQLGKSIIRIICEVLMWAAAICYLGGWHTPLIYGLAMFASMIWPLCELAYSPTIWAIATFFVWIFNFIKAKRRGLRH